MAYEKNTWATGDTITAAKLNHIEDGIEEAGTTGGSGKLQLVYIQGTGGDVSMSVNNGDDTRGETKGDTKSEKVRAVKSSGVRSPFEPLENNALYRADGTLFCEINPIYNSYEEAYADYVRIKAELDEASSIWVNGYFGEDANILIVFTTEFNDSSQLRVSLGLLGAIAYYNDADDPDCFKLIDYAGGSES